MHYLIDSFLSDNSQCVGRKDKLKINKLRDKIRYTAPNGTEFTIDCSDCGTHGEPVVTSPVAVGYDSEHISHTLGNGKVCLAVSIRGWPLDNILLYCDSWARGFSEFKKTGCFPDTPRDVFRQKDMRESVVGAIKSFFRS